MNSLNLGHNPAQCPLVAGQEEEWEAAASRGEGSVH